jgi:Tfp pilus assembly protein PilF
MMKIGRGKKIVTVCIVLTLLCIAVFGQALWFDFIRFDDPAYVTDNTRVQSPLTLDGLKWLFLNTDAGFWHPLTWLSFMMDHRFFGLNSGGYHLTNLLLHLLNTLLLFWLFHRMTKEIWPSALIAAFFALHPLHVETVAWISKRKDLLSAFFWMLSLCAYVDYTEKENAKQYLLVMLFFTLALMSKPMAVTLPVVMIILDFWPLKRLSARKDIISQLKEKSPFFLLAAVFSLITVYIRYDRGNPFVNTIPFSYRLANAPVALVTYLKKTFLPYDLAVFYPFPSDVPVDQVIIASVVLIVISVAVVLWVKKMPLLLAGWLWYVVTLLPVLGIIQVSERAFSDNYTYLPLIGVTVMFVWGIGSWSTNQALRKRILLPAAILTILVLSLLSWKQCSTWQNSITVFGHAARVTKNNFLAHTNLAFAFSLQGKNEEALYHFSEVIRINPHFPEGYYNRATTYGEMGRYALAMEDFQKAIALKPDYVDAHYNMGTVYAKTGRYHDAIKKYDEALRINPNYVLAYCGRGLAYLLQGKNEPGCRDARKACELGRCELLEKYRGNGQCH